MDLAYPQPSHWWQRDWSLFYRKQNIEDFLGGPVVKTSPSNTGDVGSIPDQGAKIQHALQLENPKHRTEAIV